MAQKADVIFSEGVDDLPGESWEFEADAGSQSTAKPTEMRGRLKKNAAFWQSFCRSRLVLRWILYGFPLLFVGGIIPAACWLKNHSSANQHHAFVTNAVAELVATGTVMPVSEKPHCVLPLGVVPKPGSDKLRLILDARYVNEHVVTPGFKYETVGKLSSVLHPNDYLFTVDLKSGYHHVDIDSNYWTYLGFQWGNQFYVFTELPFGLAPACWVFTKVTRELLGFWRSMGHRVSGYIDDSIHADGDQAVLVEKRERVLGDFERAGFVVNMGKCNLGPSQCVKYLGTMVNTVDGTLTVPQAKRERLLTEVAAVLQCHGNCQIRAVSSLTGQIMSMSFSFGELSVLMTRQLVIWQNAQLAAHGFNYNARGALTAAAMGELEFWKQSFLVFDGRRPLWQPSYFHTVKMFTDAGGPGTWSFGGWGGWTSYEGKRIEASGRWDIGDEGDSVPLLELKAMFNVLKSVNREGLLMGQRVLVHTDSSVADAVVRKGGSTVAALQGACYDILWYCIEHKINLVTTWIPREWNKLADALSKGEEFCDWMLNRQVFADLARTWGPFAVDLFASATNHQIPSYFSWFATPTCAGVNAFAHEWPRTSWCNPPFAVMGRVLAHAKACRTRVALVAPFWPGAPWWHMLVENDYAFKPFVWACARLPRIPNLFYTGPPGSARKAFVPGWETVALLLDFAQDCSHVVEVPQL
ncbi:hypothetical protein PLESTB_000711700 [Pleodorina starrii]|nr:hypothetical protein PLESTB_000711700 [Pleodorina starrii]